MKKTFLFIVAAIFVTLLPTAHAQWAVIDATNLMQNTMTAARTLEQINNQIRQLQNESRNLSSLNFNSLAQLAANLAATDRLISQAQGLAFNVGQMDADYARLYPNSYGAGTTGSQMAIDAQARWQNSVSALHTAMRLQAQAVQNFPSDEATLSNLVTQSQGAVGQLQATQATNQLLALQTRQAMQEQQLRITQDRAAALELARTTAAQARATTVRQQFAGAGTSYTPQSVSFYGF